MLSSDEVFCPPKWKHIYEISLFSHSIVTLDQNTLCLKERSPQKRNTQNSKFKVENSCHFYSWGQQRAVVKNVFDSVLLPSPFWVDSSVVIVALLISSYQSFWTGWVCTGQGVLNLWRTCLEISLELPKISLLDFLYRDFMDQFKGSRRLGDTSKTIVKHVKVHAWLY